MRRMLPLLVVVGGCGNPGPAAQPLPPTADPVAKPTGKPGKPGKPGKAAKPSKHAILDLHNARRAEHCAPPLEWSDKLAKVAQNWADELRDKGCVFGHSNTSYGENLAAGTSSALDDAAVVDMWYREVKDYSFKRGEFDASTGHFTQLVWVATKRLGCARTSCKGNDIVVCNYDPAGNVMTYFKDNVLPTSCTR